MFSFVHYTTANDVLPQDVLVSLPLRLSQEDLLAKPRRGKIPTRPPNNFLIFRMAYTKALQLRGHWDLRMREVTANAAIAWKEASIEVRDECRKLAIQAKKRHEEVYGAPPRQTRRRRQSTVTNKRRQTRRQSPVPTTSSISPLLYDSISPHPHHQHLNTPPFYIGSGDNPLSIIPQNFTTEWQNVTPYEMSFSSPTGSEIEDSQTTFNMYAM